MDVQISSTMLDLRILSSEWMWLSIAGLCLERSDQAVKMRMVGIEDLAGVRG